MAEPKALSMSQTKDDLLRHLGLDSETYSLMAKETDEVYKWLTSERHCLRDGKRQPPYDWSDIQENWKDEAMRRIAGSGNPQTQRYWELASPGDEGCPNWIARWFLYHKFRYRDGRNRNAIRSSGRHRHSSNSRSGSSRHHSSHHDREQSDSGNYYQQDNQYPESSSTQATDPYQNYAGSTTSTNNGYYPSYTYPAQSQPQYTYAPTQANGEEDRGYYDPVRDAGR